MRALRAFRVRGPSRKSKKAARHSHFMIPRIRGALSERALAAGPSPPATGGTPLTAGRRAHNYRVSQWQWLDGMASAVMLTERAARRVGQILKGEPPGSMLRVRVEGGGCSGFEYRFDLVPKAEPEDAVIEHADAKILVDSLSLVYLAGSEIDYVDDLISASFKIKNPNATAACGCGTSFSA